MKTAVLVPVHRRVDLVVDQLLNYSFSSDGCVSQFIHVSKAGLIDRDELRGLCGVLGVDAEVCESSESTGWACVYGAYNKLTTRYRLEILARYSHVYMHTDADLVLDGDLNEWLEGNPVAFGREPLDAQHHWHTKILMDERFSALRSHMGIPDGSIVGGRQEGSHIPVGLWLDAVDVISRFYGEDFFADPALHWPIEEFVLPTVLMGIDRDISPSRPLVRTRSMLDVSATNPRDQDANCMSIEDMESMILGASGGCVAAKWFSQDFNNPARTKVRSKRIGAD